VLTVLLVWADPLLTLVCGLGHLDGVEHQVDIVSSGYHSGCIGLASMTTVMTRNIILANLGMMREKEKEGLFVKMVLVLKGVCE
jgi:hypothetical protein